MASKNVAPILARHFTIQKIDTDRNVGGKEMLARLRKSDDGGIPWFVFLDAEGKALVTSNGPDGNVGCPYTDEEIAAFTGMLSKAAPSISEDELETLRKSLVARREKKK